MIEAIRKGISPVPSLVALDLSRPMPVGIRDLLQSNTLEEIVASAPPLLPTGQLPSTVEDFIKGRIIDWKRETVVSETNQQLSNQRGLLSKVINTMIYSPTEEGDQALIMVKNDLSRFRPDKELLSSPLLREWFCKFMFGVQTYTTIEAVTRVTDGIQKLSKAAGSFSSTIDRQATALAKTLTSLTRDDLPLYLAFADLFQQLNESREGESSTAQTSLKGMAKYITDTLSFVNKILAKDGETWNRLRIDWDWQQVKDVLLLLPKFHSQNAIVNIIAALETNLMGFSRTSHDNQQQLVLSTEGIVFLLKFPWKDWAMHYSKMFEDKYPSLNQKLEKNLRLADFSVPWKYLPSAAIELLSQVASVETKEAFVRLLVDINKIVANDQELTAPWLVTLLALRGRADADDIDFKEFIASWDRLPDRFREVLLNLLPGKLWLEPKGKLRSTDGNTNLQHAFPIFTSSKEPVKEEIGNQVETDPQEVVQHKREYTVGQASIVPFYGELAIIESKDAQSLLVSLFERETTIWNEDSLLNEFSQLVKDLQSNPRERRLFYHHQLNPFDSFLQNAKQVGIEGVLVDGKEVLFIFEKDVAMANISDRSIRAGLQGRLNDVGELIVSGTNGSFVGTAEQLFVNNLALHCVTRNLYGESGLIDKTDNGLIKAVHQLLADWNRSSSRSLPKIGIGQNEPYIVVLPPSYKEPVLVGELSR